VWLGGAEIPLDQAHPVIFVLAVLAVAALLWVVHRNREASSDQ
jgi:hypothetical protein